MNVTAVIVCCRTWENSSEGIDPCARTDATLAAIQTGAVRIGAAGAKMAAAYTIAPKAAGVGRCRCECMLTPRLAKLLECLSVISAATHSVNILRNKGMVAVRQGKPIHVHRPLVAGISSQRDAHAAIDCTTV